MEKWRRSGGEGVGRREEAEERGRRRGGKREKKGNRKGNEGEKKTELVYNTCVSAEIGYHSNL